MSDVDSLLKRARAYAESRKLELTTVSKRLFGDWRRLDAIASGSSFLRPPTLKTALERMSALEAQPLPESNKGASDGEANQHAPNGRDETEGTTQQRTRRSAGA